MAFKVVSDDLKRKIFSFAQLRLATFEISVVVVVVRKNHEFFLKSSIELYNTLKEVSVVADDFLDSAVVYNGHSFKYWGQNTTIENLNRFLHPRTEAQG